MRFTVLSPRMGAPGLSASDDLMPWGKKTIPLEVKHSDYDDAEDYNPNEENSVLKYEDDHSISSDVLHNHILYGNVTQHEGLECEKGNIVPLSISGTINNDAADTEHDFEDLNKDISPLALKAQSRARVDGQVPTKWARRMNVLYSGMF